MTSFIRNTIVAATVGTIGCSQTSAQSLPPVTREQQKKVIAKDGVEFASMAHDKLGLMVTRPGRFRYVTLHAFDADSIVVDKNDRDVYRKHYHLHDNPTVSLTVTARNPEHRQQVKQRQVVERSLTMPLFKDRLDSTKVTFVENAKTGFSVIMAPVDAPATLEGVQCNFDKVAAHVVEDQRRYNKFTGRVL